MKCRRVTLVNRLGLHARASAKLVQTAAGFAAEISVVRGARRANAKSIMGVMMLAAGCGAELELEASGDDAEAALDALERLIVTRAFDED